jgi:Mg2+/Co2+ transporter CorB
MMSLNRYKLRHLAQTKHKAARRVEKLLSRPDRLLGLILIGSFILTLAYFGSRFVKEVLLS